MAFIGLFGALTLVTVVTTWCFIKALKLGLSADDGTILKQATEQVVQIYTIFLMAVFAFGFGPGIVSWGSTAVTTVMEAV